MDTAVGVKTAIIGFIFVCIVMPQIIKNRHQYYLALAAVLLGILFQALATMVGSWPAGDGKFGRFCLVVNHFLDLFAILLLVMAAGGLSARQLAGDMARAYEVMRRGETEKEIIIPLEGQVPGERKASAEEPSPTRYVIDDPSAARVAGGAAPGGGEAKADKNGPIPLE